MPPFYRLGKFDVKEGVNGDTLILWSGKSRYHHLLRTALPEYRFSTLFPDRAKNYDWGIYAKGVSEEQRQKLRTLLALFQRVVHIEDALEQSFALDTQYHNVGNGLERTTIGKLVFQIKYRDGQDMAYELMNHFQYFISHHPTYSQSDFIIPMPPSKLNKSFKLPHFLAEQLSTKLGIVNGEAYVRKTRETKAMKDCESVEEKYRVIDGSFEVSPNAPFAGRVVTVIDDLYQSGATMNEFASVLKNVGAKVQALVATKTFRDTNTKGV